MRQEMKTIILKCGFPTSMFLKKCQQHQKQYVSWNLCYFQDLVGIINNHTKCHKKLDKKYDYSSNWCCHDLEIWPVVPSCKRLTFSISTKNAALRFWHLQMVSQQAKPHHDHYILAFFMESKPVTCQSTSVRISLCQKCIQKKPSLYIIFCCLSRCSLPHVEILYIVRVYDTPQ